MKTTVLVGFAEAMASAEVAWSLLDQGFEVIAFARRGKRSALRHSRFVKCYEMTPPETDRQSALADLNALIESHSGGPDQKLVILPLDDTAVWLCAHARLESGWVLAGPRGLSAELALDKLLQTHAASAAGFNVPSTSLGVNAQEVRRQAGVSFPVMLKPAKAVWECAGCLCKGSGWICASRRELEKALAGWSGEVPLLVQPFVLGTGEGLFGLAAEDGVRAWSAHRRLRMMNPQGSGSSACISQPVPEDVKVAAERFITQTGWRGMFMIELLRDRSGTPWFIEFNGRPWGSMALARRQGLEYPAWNVQLALEPGSMAGTGRLSNANLVCRNLGREFMHLLFVLRGPKSAALTEWPSFWKTTAEILHIRGGDCIYNWRKDDPKVLLTDCYYTVHNNIFKSRS